MALPRPETVAECCRPQQHGHPQAEVYQRRVGTDCQARALRRAGELNLQRNARDAAVVEEHCSLRAEIQKLHICETCSKISKKRKQLATQPPVYVGVV